MKNGFRGSITVFLSLVSVLFISLICTLAEAARVQGARAWAAAVTDMGLFSVFGEYEREILDRYDVLMLDAERGTEGDVEGQLALLLSTYMAYNTDPGKDLSRLSGRNLFPLIQETCKITGYTLATDENGEAFYQQAVENIQENLGTELLLVYRERTEEARRRQQEAEEYEKQEDAGWSDLEVLEKQQQEKDAQNAGEDQEENGGNEAESPPVSAPENPLNTIRKLKKTGILALVVKDPSVLSAKMVSSRELPSGRERREGSLEVEKSSGGAVADGIFQEYLLDHFGSYRAPADGGGLQYQMEYIAAGKSGDRENLKAVVNRLLLLREGSNFLYLSSNEKMKAQARTLALSIAGAAPVPGLKEVLEAVLLLAWAYGESLMDVRTLLAGGKIPAVKDASTWKLSLEDLVHVTELLQECDEGGGEGQSYEDYLRILLLIGPKSAYPMRALDMMENSLDAGHADAWVVRARAETSWRIPALFLTVPAAFLGTGGIEAGETVTVEFGYSRRQ